MTELVNESRNLNIRYDLPKRVWERVPDVYKLMEGWLGFGNGIDGEKGIPYWFSFDDGKKSISASAEPAGLQFCASNIDAAEWSSWLTKFKRNATEILRFKVGEIEAGEVGHETEWLD